MKSIGGYFGLELRRGLEYHSSAIKLNSGRNALKLIVKSRGYDKIYLPLFSCEVLVHKLIELKVDFEYYHIDENFEPIFNYNKINLNEGFIYINYLGLKDKFVALLSSELETLIIDNSQSFYSIPNKEIDTFYSPRKFFGVPDGGYLYTNCKMEEVTERDNSFNNFEHLLRRIEFGAENGYSYYIQNEMDIGELPIRLMSNLTRSNLCGIDYEYIKEKRRNNFIFLHDILRDKNLFNLNLDKFSVPLVYPFWSSKTISRQMLISNHIYTPVFWESVLKLCKTDDLEFKLVKEVLYLPLDQRLNKEDLLRIVALLFT